jgi:hypothetical protein
LRNPIIADFISRAAFPAGLDDPEGEITQLRRQLAAKLRKQNEQLKDMQKRFERR